MNTKLLKQKILDLAIRGKLTQQLKSDGNTADLLKEIADAKSTLSQPKGKKSKDFKQIIPLDKSEAPFEIPANWEWVRLGDVAYIASGSTPSKDCFVERGVPYLKMYNLRNQQIDFEYKPQYIKREIHEGKLARSKAKLGDVIMNIVGPPLGKVAIVPESLPECNFNQAAVLIRAHFCTNLMNQYIRYFLLQMDEINAINTKGTAGQENISLTQTQNMRLPLPPLAEQQRIVAKIEEAFAEIDAIEKNKELLKTHIKQTRQKILDLAIHGKLVPQNKADEPASVLLERITRDNPHYEKMGLDERRETKDERDSNYKRHSREGGNLPPMLSKDEVPFEVPENWCWCRLGDICKASSGKTPSTENNEFWGGDILWVTSKDVKQKYIESTQIHLSELGAQTMNLYRPNTMIIVGRSGILRHTLPVAILKRTATINQDLKALVFADEKIVEFVYVVLKAMKSHLLHEYKKAGTTVDNLNFDLFLTAPIPLPPLAEQSRIVAKIGELFAELDLVLQNV